MFATVSVPGNSVRRGNGIVWECWLTVLVAVIPDPVIDYIEKTGLYQERPPSNEATPEPPGKS